MPVQRTWKTWPIVFIDAEMQEFFSSPDLEALSIASRQPELLEGICFGVCVVWLRRYFTHQDEPPFARMSYVAKNLASAAATHFIQKEIIVEQLRPRNAAKHVSVAASKSISRSASTRVSQLNFEYLFDCLRPETAGITAQLLAQLESKQVYLLRTFAEEGESRLGCFRAISSTLRSCFGCAPEPSIFRHQIAIAYDGDGKSKVLDMNLGEFEIGQHELGRFLDEYWRNYEIQGTNVEIMEVYRVTQSDEYSGVRKLMAEKYETFRSAKAQ